MSSINLLLEASPVAVDSWAGLTALIGAVTGLLWAAIAAYAAWKLVPPLVATIGKGDFDLEIAGMKIRLSKVVEQLQRQVQDLTGEVVEKDTKVGPATPVAISRDVVTTLGHPVRRVLWADDDPPNNALYIKQLRDAGIDVVLARSTREAMSILSGTRVGAVITDMWRHEDGVDAPTAGLELCRLVRDSGNDVPILFMTSPAAASEHAAAIAATKAIGATGSPVELFRMLASVGLSVGARA